MTLYDKYGGFTTIHKIVQNFYHDVLNEETLKPYFQRVSMEFLIQHQTDFLSQVLGGPIQYKGRSLRDAHQNLQVTRSDFDTVARLLQENLEDAGVSDEDISTILDLIAGTLPDIVFTD